MISGRDEDRYRHLRQRKAQLFLGTGPAPAAVEQVSRQEHELRAVLFAQRGQKPDRAVRPSDRGSWPEPTVRRARPIPEEEDEDYDEEDDRDPVAENIIRWVPPVTALICAGIALYGFVYYQFFL